MEISTPPIYALGLFLSSKTCHKVYQTSHITRPARTRAYLFGRAMGTSCADCAVLEGTATQPGRSAAYGHRRCDLSGGSAGGDPW